MVKEGDNQGPSVSKPQIKKPVIGQLEKPKTNISRVISKPSADTTVEMDEVMNLPDKVVKQEKKEKKSAA